jgi:queuine tRNA-ribosyltransferase
VTDGFSFEIVATRGKARAGILHTPRGDIPTPVFMPVGTLGAVKAMTMAEVAAPPIDARIILANTYHLYLRPGLEVLESCGGLHRFSGWERPILTDSGGFQVFSLAQDNKLEAIDADGVTFRSHIDGSRHRFTPELSMAVQATLGSDIAMVFDQCPPAGSTIAEHEEAMARTTAWARRCVDRPRPPGQGVFAIVQGGTHVDLRERHLAEIAELPVDGVALGGLSVGESPDEMAAVLEAFAHRLPAEKPRYLMGVGTPLDLERAVAAGIDMFDCVLPTRNARNGSLFTSEGRLVVSHSRHRADPRPPDPDCPCETCQTVSRAYLRHLYMAKEVTYNRLATMHNLAFYARHMASLRAAILA